jgi:hypothetical protein
MNDQATTTTALAYRGRSIRIVELKLAADKVFRTNGGAYTWIPMSSFIEIGEQVEDIVVHLQVEDASDAVKFKAKVGFTRSPDGMKEYDSPPNEILGESAGNGYFISNAFTTRTKFGRFLKFYLGLADGADGAQTGRVTLYVALKTWGQ